MNAPSNTPRQRSSGPAGVLAAATLLCLAQAPVVPAQDAPPAVTREQILKLEEAIRSLQQQNLQLQRRVEELEGRTTPGAPAGAGAQRPVPGQATTNPPPARVDNEVRLFWKDGLNFETRDKKTFKGKLGGRVQLDAAAFSEDDDVSAVPGIGDVPAGVEFRRVRLSLEGEYAASIPGFYKVELDFAEADVAFKDVYLGLAEIPVVGKIQAGHFKEPSSLDGLISSRFLTFLERATPVEAFWPERNTGVLIGSTAFNNRATWAVGGFTSTELRAGVDGGQPLDSDYRVVGRLTGLPFHDAESRRLLHLGVSGTVAGPENGQVRFRSRPEGHLAPRFVDTGVINADHHYMLAAETAFVCGPFSLQGEYFHNWVDRTGANAAEFSGYYAAGSWFLTGEHRNYRASSGVFDRISPKHNLSFDDGGPGAWELAVRYSHLDLNDAGISGGRLDDITGGLN